MRFGRRVFTTIQRRGAARPPGCGTVWAGLRFLTAPGQSMMGPGGARSQCLSSTAPRQPGEWPGWQIQCRAAPRLTGCQCIEEPSPVTEPRAKFYRPETCTRPAGEQVHRAGYRAIGSCATRAGRGPALRTR
eukprot:274311-Hanusia_phi.AAC.1